MHTPHEQSTSTETSGRNCLPGSFRKPKINDRFNNSVYFVCTHHPAGALPLAVWITSGQSQKKTKQCLERLQNVLPPHAFGGRGPKAGPQIFMTDDDSGQIGALSDIRKDALLLLCTFSFPAGCLALAFKLQQQH